MSISKAPALRFSTFRPNEWESFRRAIVVALGKPENALGLEGPGKGGYKWEIWLDGLLEDGLVESCYWGRQKLWPRRKEEIRSIVRFEVIELAKRERERTKRKAAGQSRTLDSSPAKTYIPKVDIEWITNQQKSMTLDPSPAKTYNPKVGIERITNQQKSMTLDSSPAKTHNLKVDIKRITNQEKSMTLDSSPAKTHNLKVDIKRITNQQKPMTNELSSGKQTLGKTSLMQKRLASTVTADSRSTSHQHTTISNKRPIREDESPTTKRARTGDIEPISRAHVRATLNPGLVFETRLDSVKVHRPVHAADTPSLGNFLQKVRVKWGLAAKERLCDFEFSIGGTLYAIDLKDERDWQYILDTAKQSGSIRVGVVFGVARIT